MLLLILGLLLFVGLHLLPTLPDLRKGLIGRFGESAYKLTFSLIAAAALVIIVVGYQKVQAAPGKNPILWQPPLWGRHLTMALMVPVFPLLLAAYLPGRISATLRHPMITAVLLWTVAHLLVRGDAASVVLFGGLLAWAFYDCISLKKRQMVGEFPVKSGPISNDVISILGGLVLYGLFAKWGHAMLIGVKLMP